MEAQKKTKKIGKSLELDFCVVPRLTFFWNLGSNPTFFILFFFVQTQKNASDLYDPGDGDEATHCLTVCEIANNTIYFDGGAWIDRHTWALILCGEEYAASLS